jgi:hypothetical protein
LFVVIYTLEFMTQVGLEDVFLQTALLVLMLTLLLLKLKKLI